MPRTGVPRAAALAATLRESLAATVHGPSRCVSLYSLRTALGQAQMDGHKQLEAWETDIVLSCIPMAGIGFVDLHGIEAAVESILIDASTFACAAKSASAGPAQGMPGSLASVLQQALVHVRPCRARCSAVFARPATLCRW